MVPETGSNSLKCTAAVIHNNDKPPTYNISHVFEAHNTIDHQGFTPEHVTDKVFPPRSSHKAETDLGRERDIQCFPKSRAGQLPSEQGGKMQGGAAPFVPSPEALQQAEQMAGQGQQGPQPELLGEQVGDSAVPLSQVETQQYLAQ